ncbi:MAG: tetratricopeptide repeat protein [Bdellovibrionota bacterium]
MRKHIFSNLLLGLIVSFSGTMASAQNETAPREPAQTRSAKRTPKKKVAAKPAPKAKAKAPARPVVRKSAPRTETVDNQLRNQLSQAVRMAKAGQFQNAASLLFNLGRRPELAAEKAQIKYLLGQMLIELKLNQVAAFQFVDAIRTNHPRYSKLAIEQLSIVADGLGDDTFLNYAISKVNVEDMPPNSRDMVNFRVGEIRQNSRQFGQAIESYNKVRVGSSYFNQALFNKGLSFMELNRTEQAIRTFEGLVAARSSASVTDTNKVAAQLGIARSLYQQQKWDEAVEAYSRIPRDHYFWHDAIFEQSWAMMRSARFRSALSNFQSLHSAYYEDTYMPESLLLRAIVYLYICKFDEMDKVLSLYEKTYNPVLTKVSDFLRMKSDGMVYYQEIEKANNIKKGSEKDQTRLPYMIVKKAMEEGGIRRNLNYLRRLQDEKDRIESSSFRATALGQYGLKIIGNRARNTKLAIGDMMKAQLMNMQIEMRDLQEQAGFIRYEMINGQKETARQRISGKNLPEATVDQNRDRSFYVQNGFEYYPFRGEYWLDEIGNYHYLGQQSCE